jgi:hypothetical protein
VRMAGILVWISTDNNGLTTLYAAAGGARLVRSRKTPLRLLPKSGENPHP